MGEALLLSEAGMVLKREPARLPSCNWFSEILTVPPRAMLRWDQPCRLLRARWLFLSTGKVSLLSGLSRDIGFSLVLGEGCYCWRSCFWNPLMPEFFTSWAPVPYCSTTSLKWIDLVFRTLCLARKSDDPPADALLTYPGWSFAPTLTFTRSVLNLCSLFIP